MSRKFLFALTLTCLSITAVFATSGNEKSSDRAKRAARKLNIKVVPWGPTQADIDAARSRVESSDVVRRELNGAKYREVGFEYLYDGTETKDQPSRPPTRFRAIYYNYSSDLALIVEGDFAANEPITAHWDNSVPGISGDEIQAAYRVAEQDASAEAR